MSNKNCIYSDSKKIEKIIIDNQYFNEEIPNWMTIQLISGLFFLKFLDNTSQEWYSNNHERNFIIFKKLFKKPYRWRDWKIQENFHQISMVDFLNSFQHTILNGDYWTLKSCFNFYYFGYHEYPVKVEKQLRRLIKKIDTLKIHSQSSFLKSLILLLSNPNPSCTVAKNIFRIIGEPAFKFLDKEIMQNDEKTQYAILDFFWEYQDTRESRIESKVIKNDKNMNNILKNYLIKSEKIEFLINLLKNAKNDKERAFASDALIKIGEPAIDPIIKELQEYFQKQIDKSVNNEEKTQNVILDFFWEYQDKRESRIESKVINNDKNMNNILENYLIKSEKIEFLIDLLKNAKNDKERGFASDALIKIGEPAIDPLIKEVQEYFQKQIDKSINNEENYSREADEFPEMINFILIQIGPSVIDPVIYQLDIGNSKIRRWAILLLRQFKGEKVNDAVIEATHDLSDIVAIFAIIELRKYLNEKSLDCLISLLSWENPFCQKTAIRRRIAAIVTLTCFKKVKAVEILQRIGNDPHHDLYIVARDCLDYKLNYQKNDKKLTDDDLLEKIFSYPVLNENLEESENNKRCDEVENNDNNNPEYERMEEELNKHLSWRKYDGVESPIINFGKKNNHTITRVKIILENWTELEKFLKLYSQFQAINEMTIVDEKKLKKYIEWYNPPGKNKGKKYPMLKLWDGYWWISIMRAKDLIDNRNLLEQFFKKFKDYTP